MPKGHIKVTACFIHRPDGEAGVPVLTLPKLRKLIFDYARLEFDGLPGPKHPRGLKKLAVVVERELMVDAPELRAGFADFPDEDAAIRFQDQLSWLRMAFKNEWDVAALIDERIHHENDPESRKKGHVSKSRGPDFMDEETLVLFIGSRGFLQLNALMVIEWSGGSFRKLIRHYTYLIARLGEFDRLNPSNGVCTHVKLEVIDEKEKLYPGYFNALLENEAFAKRLRTDDVLRMIEERHGEDEEEQEDHFADEGEGI